MPLKLSVGLARKVGQPSYSSLSASCHVELELEATLLQTDLEAFQRHVKNSFNACRQAVQEELSRQQASSGTTRNFSEPANGHAQGAVHNGNGHTNGNGSHRASPKQLDYAGQLAKQIRGLGVRKLEGLANKMFNKPLADLTTLDASGLIDMLKAIKEDRVSLDDALNGVGV